LNSRGEEFLFSLKEGKRDIILFPPSRRRK